MMEDKMNNIETAEENQLATDTLNNNIDVVDENKKKKKKGKLGRIIFNIITTVLFIVIALDAAIGVINMQRINNNEEPVWYLSTKTEETELKTVTEYHLGLYKIVKTDTARETKTTLKPFFLD